MSSRTILLSFLLAACAPGAYEQGVFRQGKLAYKLGQLPGTWRRVAVREANLTFKHPRGGTILVNALCGSDNIDDVPLDVLVNQSLFGVFGIEERQRRSFILDGRAALRAHVTGTLDGVPVALDLVVLKKDGCTFDFQLVAGTDALDARRADFEALYQGFAKLSPYVGKP